ncbi:MAG: CGNR zinc finger domain-containing protein [Kineosporiaceae bacterium]
MHFNTYGGLAASLAAELVGLAHRPTPPDPPEVSELLARHQVREHDLTRRDVGALLDWACRVAPVFGERDMPAQIERINILLAESTARPYVSTHDGQPPHLHFADEHDPVVDRVRAQTSAGLAFIVCNEGGHRLGRCRRDGCERVYVDVSKAGRRVFCSVGCANRENVARHRRRSRP